MTTDPKPLTRAELLRLGAAVVNGDEDVLEAFGHAMRHLAALLPAEVLPPIDRDDERTVDALVAAKTGESRRMVTHSCPDCAHHVQERDAAIARAEAAEKRVAELEAECASISAEFDLPPTMRPVEGEIRRMRQTMRDVADVANAYKRERDEAREALRACLEVDRRWRTEPSSAELDLLHEDTFAAGWAALEGR